ncbi:CapA family protein [Lachnospiraceae bacterium 50-23]|jgi:poly-gamma-glutamate capsule biosynthesis protein CapA/YwtB (metallophosphatase superfamily)
MLAHLAVDEGADLATGHHPHVLQGVEKYKDKYIAYQI